MSVPLARRTTARVLLVGLLASSAVTLGTGAAPAHADDPAPSPSGGVSLVSSSSYSSGSTSVVVVGEVRNDWSRIAGDPVVPIDLLDASGNVLRSETARPNRFALLPGERSGFTRFLTAPAGYASYRIGTIERKPSFSVPNHGFEVVVTSAGRDKVTGTVKNTNTAAADAPEVELLFRDAAGAVYDVDTTYPKGTGAEGDLAPGETVAFEVQRFSSDPFRDGGSVSGLAESSSAPSPFPTELGLSVPRKVVAGEGGRVEITVLGRGATGAAPAGIRVQLLGREAGQSAFRVLRTFTTTGAARIGFDVKPQRDIRWQARVLEAPNATASASGFTLTQVAFGVTTTGTTSGGTATLRGRVLPASAGQLVYLQQQVGGVFRNVASYRLSSTSGYVFTLKKPKGRYVYRVAKPAVTGNQAGTGPVMVLTVF